MSAPIDESDERTELTGGVASEVVIVRDRSGREIVVKRSLPKLKVAADWRSDPERSSAEADGLRVMRELLGPECVPEVLWERPEQYSFAMERVEPSLLNWRDELGQRRVDLITARRVGALLGQMHARSASRADITTRFANRKYFEQLRIEPFFERVAQKNAALGKPIAAAIARLRAPGTALVHGDYSPKNMLAKGSHVVILDCEPVHWGNPRFDIGFCLMHLLLDGLRNSFPVEPYRTAAHVYLDGYREAATAQALDADLVRITGCLMLARLEGASPINYLDELDVADVKRRAVELITEPVADLRAAVVQVLP